MTLPGSGGTRGHHEHRTSLQPAGPAGGGHLGRDKLTEVTVNYFAVPSIVAAMWGGMLGGLMLLALAGRRGSLRGRGAGRTGRAWSWAACSSTARGSC
ncbi:MAG: hypothetical protein R2838_10235 [Caldilineaceae bacterium]